MNPVPFTLAAGLDWPRDPLPWHETLGTYCPDHADGAAMWTVGEDGAVTHLTYVSPCGSKDWRRIPVQRGEGPGWCWDGNRERPTLTPSIWQDREKGGWHGHLTEGVWKPC